MWSAINLLLQKIDEFVWGVPLMVLILCGGLLLTVRLNFLQFFKLPLALKWMFHNEAEGEGEVSSFAALCTALSATIGTGNIVGVATAVGAGGPGAVFWIIAAAFFGMATKYAEGLLAVKYRSVDPETGHALGGPFYYIEKGMGTSWKWLAKMFAFFGVCVGLFGIGTFSQVNGISSAVKNFFDPNSAHLVTIPGVGSYSISVVIASIVLSLCVGLVLIGGLKRISQVSQIVVPFMAVIYILSVVVLIICNISKVPEAVATIIAGAFNPRAVTGGAIGSMIIVMQKGIARGIFSNEAGLTGISIVLTGAWQVKGLEGVEVTSYAFAKGLPFSAQVSAFILMICLVFFAFTTILGWDYYSERCLEYLTGGNKKLLKVFRYLYILAVFVGPYLTVSAVWTIADIFNGLMAIPNMIAIFALSGVVVKETKDFFAAKKDIEIRRRKYIIYDLIYRKQKRIF